MEDFEKPSGREPLGSAVSKLAPLGLGLAVFLLAVGSIVCTRDMGRIASVWPVNALAVVVLLRRPRDQWMLSGLAAMVGNLAANMVCGDGPAMALTLALCNALEVCLCLWLLRRTISDDLDLTRRRDLLTFVAVGGVIAPLASAAVAAVTLSGVGHGAVLSNLAAWYPPDALGLLIVGPALLAFTPAGLAELKTRMRRGQALAPVCVLIISLAGVFGQTHYPLFFLALPALILIAFRLGTAAAAIALLATSLTAVVATLLGYGPAALIHGGLGEQLRVLQLFLLTTTLVVLPLTTVLAERRRLEASLREALGANEVARATAEEADELSKLASQIAGIGMWRREIGSGQSHWSDHMFRLHGVTRAVFGDRLGEAINLYHPDDQGEVLETIARCIATGEPFDLKVRLRRADDGAERIVVFKGQADFGPNQEVTALFGVMRDVTEEQTALRRIQASEGRFRLLAESATDIVLQVDSDDTILFISPSVRRYGYEPEAMVGKCGASFIHPEDVAKILNRVRRLASGELLDPKEDRAYRMVTADGLNVWVEGHSAVVRDADGTQIGLISHLRDVSDRFAAQAALQTSEARYRLLTENATDIIACYGADARFTFVSPAVAAVLGYAPEDLIGRSPAEFMHPDDLKRSVALFSAHVRAGPGADPLRFEYRAFRSDGDMVWLEAHPKATYHPQTGAFVEFQDVVRDITERKRVEAALGESEFRYRVIAESATDIISRMGVDGRVRYFSPSVTAVTGYAVEDVVGRSMIPLLHPDDIEPTLRQYRQLISGEAPDKTPLVYRIRHRDGGWIWLEGAPTVVRNPDGSPSEIIDVRRDISAKVRLEAELRAARDSAEAATAVKSDFMANMSHEIRTPLTAILGFAGLLSERSDLTDGAHSQVSRIATAGRALLAIVNDLLDFSKLEAGQVEIAPRPVAVAELLQDTLMMFSAQADAKGLTLASAMAGDLPAAVAIDPDRVRQVLLNLIGNAIKFTDAGSVRLVASYNSPRQMLELTVEDTGAGLTRAQQARLFKRFSQVDASSTRKHGGTGLGLAICKGLVEAMGGKIGVRSKVGQGSAFHIRIKAPPCVAPAATGFAQSFEALAGARVLVVDDNPINRELVTAVLTPLGVEVTEAASARAALDATQVAPFDAILMDLRMPDIGGARAAAMIRQALGPNQHIPILAFSADVDVAGLAGVAAVFDGVVQKPLVAADLAAALVEALRFDPQASASPQADRADVG